MLIFIFITADPIPRRNFSEKPPRAVFTIRLEPAEVTLGNLDAAMAELWRATENFSRRLGA